MHIGISFFVFFAFCAAVLTASKPIYAKIFFFNDTATTEIYTTVHTLSLHDALPIYLPCLAGGRGDGDDHLVRPVVAQQVGQVVGRPEHPDAVQPQVLLARVVVDEPRGRVAKVRVLEHLPEDQLARVTGSNDEDVAPARDQPPPARSLEDRPRREPAAGHEREEDEPVDDDDPAREPEARHRVPEVER